MINEESLLALSQAQWTPHFKRPLYEDYAFSCLVSTISKLLTGEGENPLSPQAVGGSYKRYDCVVLFLIDGFGWSFFETYRHQYPALQRFVEKGVASQISSEFPSTTAAHLTTLHTGQEVGQTGIYEWFQYEPLVDEMVAPVLVSYAGDYDVGRLVKEGYPLEALFPFETVYQKLAKKGVRSLVFQQDKIANSAYSKALLAGAEVIPFGPFSEVLDLIVQRLHQPCEEPTYLFIYFGEIDAVGHRQGITSPQFEEAMRACWSAVEERLWKKLEHLPNRTALLFTADHGMTAVDPKTTILLNRLCPELPNRIKKNKRGELLIPAGSCRDFFLHIEEEFLHQTQRELQEKLHGVADVVFTQELLEKGFFGSKPVSQRLKERIGNLVVLPYKGENVFWHFEKHRFEQHFYGAHGGLTAEEMESIFLFADLSERGI